MTDFTKPLADPEAEARVQAAMELLRQNTAQGAYDLALADLHRANEHSRACRLALRDALAELTAARVAVAARWDDETDDEPFENREGQPEFNGAFDRW